MASDPFQPHYFEESLRSEVGNGSHGFDSRDQRSGFLTRNLSLEVIGTLPQAPLEYGASGDAVSALQSAIHALGYLVIESLGSFDEKSVFGDKTFAALAS